MDTSAFRAPAFFLFLALTIPNPGRSQEPTRTQADPQSESWQKEITGLIAEAVAAGDLPGAVVGLWHDGDWKLRQAHGSRQLEPSVEPMTLDTIFDMASITKPVATAASVMLLSEQGKVDLYAPVSRYLPDFTGGGRETVLVKHLLTHSAGLIPDNALADYQQGVDEAWRRLMKVKVSTPVGTKFVYSDVGFLLLGKIVEAASGMSVHEFSQRHIFQPLGMRDTGYLPIPEKKDRIAPTEQRDGQMLRGVVHDPRAALLGGVAGHAGLFSTLDDLAVFGRMMLGSGQVDGKRICQPETILRMVQPHAVESRPQFGRITRALGWDHHSTYSYNGGDRLSPAAFGHGGFTGTVFWIDPDANLFFIFLSNRLHPDGKGNVNRLAGRVASIAVNHLVGSAESTPLEEPPAPRATVEQASVQLGIDVLRQRGFRDLHGKRVGLITNQTGIDQSGKRTARWLAEAPGVKLVALFSPEHGPQGNLDVGKIGDSRDPESGIPVYSLYGETRRPSPEHLAQVDCLVYDIQDIGARFYTYIATLKECMRALDEQGKQLIVLDRPNPLGGVVVNGPMRDASRESFVACHPLPVQHGLTVGELSLLFKKELGLKLDLQIVPVRNWRREQTFESTGLWWIDPSPNMRGLLAANLYPGIGLLETTNISVGRGTERPFEWIGAPWIDGQKLAAWFNAQHIPGCQAVPRKLTPSASKYAKEECSGVQLLVTETRLLDALQVGFTLANGLRTLHGSQWEFQKMDVLLVNQRMLEAVASGAKWADLKTLIAPDLAEFQSRRRGVLLYD